MNIANAIAKRNLFNKSKKKKTKKTKPYKLKCRQTCQRPVFPCLLCSQTVHTALPEL